MLTREDLADAKAIWDERVGPGFDLDVQIIGEHAPPEMDQDRPLGAILRTNLSLRVVVIAKIPLQGRSGVAHKVICDEPCPYSRDALLASVRALSAVLLAD